MSSQYVGVTWNRHQQRYVARLRLRHPRRLMIVGTFTNELAAAAAWDRAALHHRGPDARLNFPDLTETARERLIIAGRSKHSSGFRGVSFHKGIDRWTARITRNGTVYNLGCYRSEVEAARAYDRAALALHGPAAQTNFRYPEAAP